MKQKTRLAAFLFFLLGTLAAHAIAQDGAPHLQNFHQVQISPDGSSIAWVQDAASGTSIYIQDLKDPHTGPRRISAAFDNAGISEDGVAWSPDSKRLAFIADAGKQGQLCIADIDGSHVRKLTSLTGALANPAWSPDGKSIAFLFTQDAPRADPLLPMAAETGVIAETIYEQRLTVVDIASGNVRQLSPADMYVYEFGWSPDSKNFAVTAAHGAGDAHWFVAQLYTLGLAIAEMKSIYKPALQIATPAWSPDGKNIAFIEGLMSDAGFTGGDIFIVPSSGGNARNLTPGIAASPAGIYWDGPSKILFPENIDGEVGAASLDLNTGKVHSLWTGPEEIVNTFWGSPDLSLSADRATSAVIRHDPKHAPEIWAGPIGQWKQVTHANDALRPDWGDTQSLHWMNHGMKIQGRIMFPKNYDPGQRYPLVVVVHGGPATAVQIGWPQSYFNTYQLSAHGYFVLYPNPRGSYGFGEKFARGNVKDFGYGDFQDILAGVDEAVKTFPIDNDRVGITGWSYGGYMTMWAVTQTHRFRAAVSGAGLANWLSYYGENDIDEWMPPYFGASVYDDPAIYARSAPINFVKNVKTPTLILVGERDGECPTPQSREFWHALKAQGVETQLVIYPGEGHIFSQPEHQRDAMDRLLGWFDHYLKAPAESARH